MTTHDQDDARRKAINEMREIAFQLSAVGDHSAATVVRKIADSVEALRRGMQHPPAPAFPAVEDLPAARKNASERLAEIALRLHAKGDYDAAGLVYDPLARGARGV